MKSIFLLLALAFSLSGFAQDFATIDQRDPNFCGSSNYCHKWLKGEYYARGVGRNCNQAMKRADDLFVREYGDMSCGLVSGPHLDNWSCRRQSNGQVVAWLKCDPSSEPRRTNRPRCAIIFGQMVCS
jgi:hypothetical protein